MLSGIWFQTASDSNETYTAQRPSETLGKSVTTSAVNMVNWLKSYFGTPDVTVENPLNKEAVETKIGNRKGIYAMLPKSNAAFGASGHVTLWHNKNAIGNNDYARAAKVVYFWELK